MGLVHELRESVDNWLDPAGAPHKVISGHADELSAALSLSEEEREAIAELDNTRRYPKDGQMRIAVADYDTLRALIARFTNIGEVK